MCIILDANKYSEFLNPKNKDMQPVRNWIKKGGRIAYSPTEKFEKELTIGMKLKIFADFESNNIKFCNKKSVERTQNSLQDLVSDDPHIIALAQVANVKLLVSSDKKLHADFKKIIKGNVYQNSSHAELLDNCSCP